jgi:hypothetical protein
MHGATVKICSNKFQHTTHRSVSQPRYSFAIIWSLADTRSFMGTECTKNCALRGHLKMGPMGCPETSAINYRYSPRNNPEERSSHFPRDGRLKTRTECTKIGYLNCLPCGSRKRSSRFPVHNAKMG